MQWQPSSSSHLQLTLGSSLIDTFCQSRLDLFKQPIHGVLDGRVEQIREEWDHLSTKETRRFNQPAAPPFTCVPLVITR